MISETIDRLLAGDALSAGDTEAAVGLVMRGEADPAQIAGLLVALRAKGETVDELVGAARAMRAHVVPVRPARGDLVDTAGTGGDGSGTFNISTTAALVAAACGCAVAKHGNRAASSRSGSADMLEALGVPIALTPEQAAGMIEQHGFGYLHAPDHHPAMRHAGPVRRSLGVRTVFNLLGPLTNPAGARRQLIGVYAPQWVEPMAQALAALGCDHGMVVHGEPGIDELSPCGATTVATVRGTTVTRQRAGRARARHRAVRALRPGGRRAAAQCGDRARGARRRPRPGGRRHGAQRRGGDRGGGARRRSRRRFGAGARGTALRSGNGDVVGAARRGEGSGMSYLEGIGAWTRERLEERRETRSLAASLLHTGAKSVIAEVKRSSPSQGEIAPEADPATIAQQYERGGAAAISVLTSARDFGGSYADLAAVRAVVDVPILCKDFFVDVWQVTEARVHGADAILVLLALVEDNLAADLIQAAEDLEMEALVEVHDGPELERALDLGTPIIGVNARDLATLEIDRGRQIELLRRLPRGLLRIAESGIETPDHARAVREAGADALLVGTALMRDPDLLPALVR